MFIISKRLYVARVERQGMHTEFWWGNILESNHIED
jgi:hypothetical protein